MSSILILDYSTDRSEAAAIRPWLPSADSVTVHFVDADFARTADLPDLSRFSHIIHSGSALSIMNEIPFTAAAEGLIRDACARRICQMGICYGHQLLCRALVGPDAVRRAPQGLEVGWGEVEFTAAGQNLLGVGGRERVWQYHFDEVAVLPPGSELLATNGHTRVQAFRNRQYCLLGTQFHPEFDREEGNRILRADAKKLAKYGYADEVLVRDGPSIDAGNLFFSFFLGQPA